MKRSNIEELLDDYVQGENYKGCFLVSGDWGIGKTYLINNWSKKHKPSKKFVHISLFGKKCTSAITAEINSELIHPFEHYGKALLKSLKGVSIVKFDLAPQIGESSQFERENKKKTQIVFVFDDLERTAADIEEVLGYINNINEKHRYKVIVVANTNKITDDKFDELKEKVFFTETTLNDSFIEAAPILLPENLKSYEEQIIDSFLSREHYNLRTLIHAAQKIDQLLGWVNADLDEGVYSSIIKRVTDFSIDRTRGQTGSEGDAGLDDFARALSGATVYNMDFLEPFVKNSGSYSMQDIKLEISKIQQFAADNKESPLSRLGDWFYMGDEKFLEVISEIKAWVQQNKIEPSQYPNMMSTLDSSFFLEKLSMFTNGDEYLQEILNLMQRNLQELSFEDLSSLRLNFYGELTQGRGGDYLSHLYEKFNTLFNERIEQALDCDLLFCPPSEDLYGKFDMCARNNKDLLNPCKIDVIMDRLRSESNLWAIDNLRGALLGFYRSYYPWNCSTEDRRTSLRQNVNALQLIDSLEEYLKSSDIEKSKRFVIQAMIGNLKGEYF